VLRTWITEGNKKLKYRNDNAGRRSLRRSRSFEVLHFGINQK